MGGRDEPCRAYGVVGLLLVVGSLSLARARAQGKIGTSSMGTRGGPLCSLIVLAIVWLPVPVRVEVTHEVEWGLRATYPFALVVRSALAVAFIVLLHLQRLAMPPLLCCLLLLAALQQCYP